MRTLIALLCAGLVTAQTWYPYAPLPSPCASTGQCLYLPLSVQLKNSVASYGSPAMVAALVCQTWQGSGDFSGEFWAWVDFHPGVTPMAGIAEPILFSALYGPPDDAMEHEGEGMVWRMFPIAYAPQGTMGTVGTITGQPAQWGGCAVTVDLSSPGCVPIAELIYDPYFCGQVATIQLHVVGNLMHEWAGSGWAYWTATVAFAF